MTHQRALENVGNLLRQEDRARVFVVHAGQPQNRDRNLAALVVQHLLGRELRSRIWRSRIERRILIDLLPALSRRVHQQRARKDQALDLERLQRMQQTARAFDRDRLILRARIARQIVVSGQVNHRGNRCAVAAAHALKRCTHAVVRGQVGEYRLERGRRGGRHHGLEPNHREPLHEARNQRAAEEAATAGDDD